MVWNPFVNTNINLDLIWHNKMALTNLSTTMIANMLYNIDSRLKCCNIVGCHSKVLYDSINRNESVVSWHTCCIFIEELNAQPTEAGHSMYPFINLEYMVVSHLVESDTQTDTSSINETLINRTNDVEEL